MPNELSTAAAWTPDHVAGESYAPIPHYLGHTYYWAYLNPVAYRIFDRRWMVNAILWGNLQTLMDAALAEVQPGTRVLQTACVYGPFSQVLAKRIGATGLLDIIDAAPIQVEGCRRKVADLPYVSVRQADAVDIDGGAYDTVVCFFLLHEVPDPVKRQIVASVLRNVRPGGKAVFVDYHLPRALHPLKPLMKLVFDLLEPFAETLWRTDIPALADWPENFAWQMDTYFGGLYQKVVARRL